MHKSTKLPGERLTPAPTNCVKSESTSQLDTFSLTDRQTPEEKQKVALKKLGKRAQSKFVTNVVAFPLAQLRSPLQKQYKRSTNCAGEITETPGKYTALYCNCRWCLVCSRIRTGRLIVGYLPAIQAMEEKWFLTLSRPNVVGPELLDEIRYYLKTVRKIQRNLREEQKLEFSSLRKIECTYNEVVNTYHPHFHFIFDSQEAAQAFLDQWLDRNSVANVGKARAAILNKGNQLKQANDRSVAELFKYFTKVVSKSQTKAANGIVTSDYRIHLEALDTMFQAMAKVRTFQPCGVIKAVSEDVEPEQAVDSGREQVNHWKWLRHDWVNVETEAALTGFVPSEHQERISSRVVYPVGVPALAPTDVTPYYVDKATGEVVPAELVDVKLMRNNFQYAKIYPVTGPDKPAKHAALRPLPPCAYFCGPDSSQDDAAPISPVLIPAAPVAPQTALFETSAPGPGHGARRGGAARPSGKKLSPTIKKPARKKGAVPAQGPVAPRAAHLVDLATDAPTLFT